MLAKAARKHSTYIAYCNNPTASWYQSPDASRQSLLQQSMLLPPHGSCLNLHTLQDPIFDLLISHILADESAMSAVELVRSNGLPHLV